MRNKDKVGLSLCSLLLFLFLLVIAINVKHVTELDDITHQSTMLDSESEKFGIHVAGTPHGPIDINGDADFAAQALAEGWPGDGSSDNPYIIDGLDIALDGIFPDSCIDIRNTRVNFTISNCVLTRAMWAPEAGIRLKNVNMAN